MSGTIQVDQVSKRFGKKLVLENIHLNIKKGNIHDLIGHSSSGKTTLVKMIVGMDLSDHGNIQVLNQTVPKLSLLQKIGYMAQSDALYGELTGLENLKFFASLYKLNKKEQKERIAYTVELVQLDNSLKKK